MKRLNKLLLKFLHLDPAERRLLVGAALLISVIRPLLRVLPFTRVRGILSRLKAYTGSVPDKSRLSPGRVQWAVRAASRRVPGRVSCLVEAVTAEVLLARSGYPAKFLLGVATAEAGATAKAGKRAGFEAHAWVESGGSVIAGKGELERFTPLRAPGGESL